MRRRRTALLLAEPDPWPWQEDDVPVSAGGRREREGGERSWWGVPDDYKGWISHLPINQVTYLINIHSSIHVILAYNM